MCRVEARGSWGLDWKDILDAISAEGLKRVMIEGGADVIQFVACTGVFFCH